MSEQCKKVTLMASTSNGYGVVECERVPKKEQSPDRWLLCYRVTVMVLKATLMVSDSNDYGVM
jgi:hypothetical protein